MFQIRTRCASAIIAAAAAATFADAPSVQDCVGTQEVSAVAVHEAASIARRGGSVLIPERIRQFVEFRQHVTV